MLNCLPHDVGEMLVRTKRLCVLSGVLHAMCAIGCATQSNARSAFICWPEELVCAKVSSSHSCCCIDSGLHGIKHAALALLPCFANALCHHRQA